MLDFFENIVWYFQKYFDIWKGARISNKNSREKDSSSWEGLAIETRAFRYWEI